MTATGATPETRRPLRPTARRRSRYPAALRVRATVRVRARVRVTSRSAAAASRWTSMARAVAAWVPLPHRVPRKDRSCPFCPTRSARPCRSGSCVSSTGSWSMCLCKVSRPPTAPLQPDLLVILIAVTDRLVIASPSICHVV